MDPLSLLVSAVTLVDTAAKTYKAIEKIKNHPKAFKEVNDALPAVKRTLSEAVDFYEQEDQPVQTDLLPIAKRCEENVAMLNTVFGKVAKSNAAAIADDDMSWDVAVKRYSAALLKWGKTLAKSRKVELLMKDILRDVDMLSKHRVFRTSTFTQVAEVQKALQQLSIVEPSITDEYLDTLVSSNSNIQNIASGGRGWQNNNYADSQYANFGTGSQFNITGGGTNNFSMAM